MNRLDYSPGLIGLLVIGLLIIVADIVLRVWVPPAEAPSDSNQTEQALSRSPLPEARLATPFDPFYTGVATRVAGADDQSGGAASDQSTREPVFGYRALAISETENGRLRAVIKMTFSEGPKEKAQEDIETVSVGDAIGDARVTAISAREVRLESASLGTLTLTLFLPPSAAPGDGPASVES